MVNSILHHGMANVSFKSANNLISQNETHCYARHHPHFHRDIDILLHGVLYRMVSWMTQHGNYNAKSQWSIIICFSNYSWAKVYLGFLEKKNYRLDFLILRIPKLEKLEKLEMLLGKSVMPRNYRITQACLDLSLLFDA